MEWLFIASHMYNDQHMKMCKMFSVLHWLNEFLKIVCSFLAIQKHFFTVFTYWTNSCEILMLDCCCCYVCVNICEPVLAVSHHLPFANITCQCLTIYQFHIPFLVDRGYTLWLMELNIFRMENVWTIFHWIHFKQFTFISMQLKQIIIFLEFDSFIGKYIVCIVCRTYVYTYYIQCILVYINILHA